VLGQHALRRLAGQERYQTAFADIDCPAPPGLSRAEFLEQVQYLANLPDQLDRLDPALAERLHRAFAVHPWVAEVKRVEQVPGQGLRVQLRHREPVLVVPLASARRAVDATGVLLPSSAPLAGLPVYDGTPPRPAQPGRPWGDARLEGAARLAGLLRLHLERLGLASCTIEEEQGRLTLRTPRTCIVWGRPPGQEAPDEVETPVRLRRLLRAGKLDGHTVEVWRLPP
jgi:hypothetical protein